MHDLSVRTRHSKYLLGTKCTGIEVESCLGSRDREIGCSGMVTIGNGFHACRHVQLLSIGTHFGCMGSLVVNVVTARAQTNRACHKTLTSGQKTVPSAQ